MWAVNVYYEFAAHSQVLTAHKTSVDRKPVMLQSA